MRQIWHSSIWKCECWRSSLFSQHSSLFSPHLTHHCFHLTSLITVFTSHSSLFSHHHSSLFSHHIHHCFHIITHHCFHIITSLITHHLTHHSSLITSHHIPTITTITTITSQQSQSPTMLSGIHRLDSGRLVTSTSSFVFSSSLVLSSTISFSAIRSNQNFSAVSSGSSHERRKNSKIRSDMVVFTNAGLHADETPLTHRHPQRSSCCYP